MSSYSNSNFMNFGKWLGWISVLAAAGLLSRAMIPWLKVHLFQGDIWFDESGQYWLALGLHHFSAPLSQPGGWYKIVEYGRVMNSDPGTYTLLLRGWINLFGSELAALRSLSLLFFLCGPLVILCSGYRLGVNAATCALAALAPCGYFMLYHYATEIRAYSMEALAVMYFFFLAAWANQEFRPGRLLMLGGLGALLVGSRYSAYLYGAAACLVTLVPWQPFKRTIIRSCLIGIPITAAVSAGFLIFGRHQAGGAQRAPAYVEAFLLQGKDTAAILAQLRQNFCDPEALPITIFLIIAPALACFGPASMEKLKRFLGRASLFVVISLVFIAIASWTGKLPWAIHTRWSIGYQALSAVCLASLVFAAGALTSTIKAFRLQQIVGLLLCVASLIAWSWRIEQVQKLPRPYYETVGSLLKEIAKREDGHELRFWVSVRDQTSVKYLCEDGPFKGRFDYPGKFHFETAEEASKQISIHESAWDVIVLHNQSLLPEYSRRVVTEKKREPVTLTSPPPSALIILKQIE
jgi:hypothetical protein